MDDGRTPDAGVIGILIAHLGAFGSGELINKQMILTLQFILINNDPSVIKFRSNIQKGSG